MTALFALRAGCEDAVSPVSGWSKCQSFSYFEADGGRCVGIVAANEWIPHAADGVISGRVTWPARYCSSAVDCSHNGICDAGTKLCQCAAAWKGDRCQTLALLPAARNAGLRLIDSGANTSSWGGQVLYDPETKKFHMWCGSLSHDVQ